ncbi:hypothetical protein [Pseudonocardia broussonetiae]|uniref:Integral membrane protein n=1 Tax=Pseudonocardia broussonetiae TaxID=2736640 RepID=A0A6M6JPX5_9PSEU|nr:hypothetical protein [Pseudonocardia broussonetiae]QJY48341.1 hypothetical protein HOP40_23215 [Pseudonocardia broussonetiae]
MDVTTPVRRGTRWDLLAVAAVAGLVVAAHVVGEVLKAGGTDIFLGLPPLLAVHLPHAGPGTPVALVVAVAVVVRGPDLARRLAWRPLLLAAYAASALWTVSLALVDGWTRGVVERLTSDQEYLWDVPRVTDVPATLRTFTDFILPGADTWVTHVGAHPPGVLLLYVLLDRVGLGGGGASGVVTMLVGASACVAVAVALRALGAEETARAALPFGVLFPGAVWVGVSADGMFAAVLAWGVALLAFGAAGERVLPSVAGGVLLGSCLYLSYGLVLGGLVPLAVLGVTRSWRAGLAAAAGVALVVAAFTLAGFWWFDGFARVQVIYALSVAATRPYSYFVWANLAALALALGPAVVAGLRRLDLPRPAVWLVVAAAAAVLLADLSGLSKAEVERIWLPFAVWLVVACARLPHARAWLAAQAALALAVNHLLLTVW